MNAASVAPEMRSRPRSLAGEIGDVVRSVALALLAALVLRVVAFQPFTIPSSSMEPGLVTGDYIMVSKLSYGWSRASLPFNPPLPGGRLFGRAPARGDVVVFREPDDEHTMVIKRVIGLPGDRIQIQGGAVILNGRPLATAHQGRAVDRDAPGLAVDLVQERTPEGRAYRTFDRGPGHEGDETGVYTIPAERYFVMGDNRDNSLDSRWAAGVGMGFVPAENLVGEAKLVLLSWRPGASLFKPWTWFAVSGDRFFRPIR